MMRSDAPLIKMLTNEFGLSAAQKWQKMPYIQMPAGLWGWTKEQCGNDGKFELNPDLYRLPWDSAVYRMDLDGDDETWVLITEERGFFGMQFEQLPDPITFCLVSRYGKEDIDPTVIFESIDRIGFNRMMSGGENGDSVYGCLSGMPKNHVSGEKCLEIMTIYRPIIYAIIQYMQQTPCHPTAVRNARAKPDSKNKKPWTRRDLEHIILIDPLRVNDYRATAGGGTHASPRLHQRRGHWRRIRIDDPEQRRVFVRPSWVGDREWEYQGQTYKVLGK